MTSKAIMKQISATSFIKHWRSFSDKMTTTENWEKHWQTNSSWSNFILRTKSSSNIDSPIGDFFKNEYPDLRYRTEDGLFDLTMSLHKNFKHIPTLNRSYQREFLSAPKDTDFYPTIYDILLEHENYIYDSWNEVAKLTYVRGFLKILVTYNTDNLPKDWLQKENEMMFDTFKTIIEQGCRAFPDCNETEYLLLIGRKENNNLLWTTKIFDANGNPTR